MEGGGGRGGKREKFTLSPGNVLALWVVGKDQGFHRGAAFLAAPTNFPSTSTSFNQRVFSGVTQRHYWHFPSVCGCVCAFVRQWKAEAGRGVLVASSP